MDYEKEYKEALERARDVYTYYCDDREQLRKIESTFPELKESEDEKVRKELIDAVQSLWDNDALPMPLTTRRRNEWLAWLEKQKQVKDSANFQHENKMCKENGDSLTNEDEKVRQELLAVINDLVLPDEQQSRFNAWLEKQGKASPILSNSSNIVKNWDEEDEKRVKNILSVLDAQACWDGATMKKMNPYQKEIDWVKSLSLQGRSALEAANEPADNTNKVVARFKVGDWIVSTSNIYKIISLNDGLNCYIAVTPNNKEVKIPYYFDDGQGHMCSYHLWTINDARDGDVLALNNEVFIYAHRKQTYSIAVAHCFVNSAGGFYLDGEFGYRERGETIFPATKEQRDTLWSAMREADYKWDSKIKKAIKI